MMGIIERVLGIGCRSKPVDEEIVSAWRQPFL
jgi:hypothetical protein